MKLGLSTYVCSAALAGWLFPVWSLAQSQGAFGPSTVAISAASAAAPASSSVFRFAMLGAYEPLRLRGPDDTRTINLGVRLDHVVTAATLTLRFTYSPALIFPLSHLKVSINGEAVATVPFDSEHAGQMVARDIALDPRFLTDYNQINVQLIAHYTLDHCEDPENSSLWADVSPTSEVRIDTIPLKLPNDLSLLPAPFFDRRDPRQLRLPFVLPAAPDDSTLESAGILASWFGELADYRQARFPVSTTLPPDAHGVVLGPREQLPPSVTMPAIDGPTLMIIDNPAAPNKKLLIVTGRNDAEVKQAADALVLGKAAFSGSEATVQHIDIGPIRRPYDAPRWLPIGHAIPFKQLVDDPRQLQVAGSRPDAIRLNLRVPADLYSWSGRGVPIDLKYRYTAPTVQNNSALSISINDLLVKSLRLPPAKDEDGKGRLQLPILGGADTRSANLLDIPAFRVGSTNQLQLRFDLDSQKTGLCQGVAQNPVRAAIDPDSTIDFSHFVHYARMPDLAYFANSGFPFTRYADLSQTAVVLPDRPGVDDLGAFLTALGHMGQWTGLPSLRVQVVRAAQAQQVHNKDLLMIGDSASGVLPPAWRTALPLWIVAGADGQFSRTAFSVKEYWRDGVHIPEGSARLAESGPIAALLGFEIPGSHGRSGVAMTGTSPARLGDVLDVLEKPDRVAQLQGDVALVRDGRIESMRVGDTYVVGYVPWYAQIWGWAVRHPILLGVLGALGGLLLAIAAFTALQELSARRRGI
ncbi:cellulose biosynthesis cyclic di-GMP-binding regulatory protein BcsB [Trinickia symbiotica]|uniref:Cyclic di-GMP-binding protein n=1 Tax=Trinickia symbiotica TaxID=863227 RepID=A0A2T3XMW6_9BURK|nr:cellulose biosynthesis cyclic di-GMP-binding regulatory protein BcsB [Trinickia symbiotica]PTB17807.1 cellulose biosynthesis cyclic di-GMP-binding regulatory protein BcsB [Trinickia symbiotica]